MGLCMVWEIRLPWFYSMLQHVITPWAMHLLQQLCTVHIFVCSAQCHWYLQSTWGCPRGNPWAAVSVMDFKSNTSWHQMMVCMVKRTLMTMMARMTVLVTLLQSYFKSDEHEVVLDRANVLLILQSEVSRMHPTEDIFAENMLNGNKTAQSG